MNPDSAFIQKLSGLEGYLASKIRGQLPRRKAEVTALQNGPPPRPHSPLPRLRIFFREAASETMACPYRDTPDAAK